MAAKIPEHAKKVFTWILYDVYQWEQEMFDWTFKIFEMLKKNDTIDIIAILENWKILIFEEEQPNRSPFYWLVWWTCEDWEEPLETAKRELLEETWMTSKDWAIFNKYRKSSKIDYHDNIFIARNCKKIQEQNLDAWEKIKILEVDWEWFKKYVLDEKFRVKEFTFDVLKYLYEWKEEELKKIIYWE